MPISAANPDGNRATHALGFTFGPALDSMQLSGVAIVEGQPIQAGTLIRAYVHRGQKAALCSQGLAEESPRGSFRLNVASDTQIRGCGVDGASIRFKIGHRTATAAISFSSGGTNGRLRLTAADSRR